MAWLWYFSAILLFYLFAILQNSFFAYFSFWGFSFNFVFLLFFIFIFFARKNTAFKIIFFSILAGFLIDVFSVLPMGTSILLLAAIGFLTKKIQSLLKEKKNKYYVFRFVVLFLTMLAVYSFSIKLCYYLIGF